MDALIKGVASGIESGDVITLIEIVWKLGGETEAAAQAAGRGVNLSSPTDIAAYQASGYALSSANLLANTSYTPSVRVTESRGGAGAYVGAWNDGSLFFTGVVAEFLGASVDTGFSAHTVGSGSVTVSGGFATIATTSVSGDIAWIGYDTALASSKIWNLKSKGHVNANAGLADNITMLGITKGATAPATGFGATINSTEVMEIFFNTGIDKIAIRYADSSTTFKYWTGSAWQASFTNMAVATRGTDYVYGLTSDGTNLVATVKSADESATYATATIPWSSIYNSAGPHWLFAGDINGDTYFGTAVLDYIRVQ